VVIDRVRGYRVHAAEVIMDTPILQVQLQRTPMDCGVAVLAMLLGKSYEGVLIVAGQIQPTLLITGMHWPDLVKVANQFGYRTKKIRAGRIDLDIHVGALCVTCDTWTGDHLVVLKEGMIVDTDGSIWDADVFMSVHKARPTSLLVLDKQEEE
jgi:hypothetical protein